MMWKLLRQTFGNYFWVWLSVILASLVVILSPSPFAHGSADADSSDVKTVYHLTLNDKMISPITAEYIERGIEKAHEDSAALTVIELDTPGGMLGSTHTIMKTILNAPMPVVVYVAPSGSRAGSAGVFITMTAHVAAMAPSTRIGAAHPVDSQGKWPVGKKTGKKPVEDKKGKEKNDTEDEGDDEAGSSQVMSEKIMNDTLASMRAVAKLRGRNEEWALKAITDSDSITAEEALKKNVIDFIASDLDDVLTQTNGRTVRLNDKDHTIVLARTHVVTYDFSFRQQVLSVLTHPFLAYLLLMLGFYGLLFEVTHPGFGVPGVAGLVCIVLALIAMQAMSINMAGLALIIIGVCFFIAEFFTPAFGLLFGGGALCLILGAVFIYKESDPYIQTFMPSVIGVTVAFTAIAGFVLYKLMRVYRRPAVGPREALVGEVGRVIDPIAPDQVGAVKVYGEIWSAIGEEALGADSTIQVVALDEVDTKVLKVKRYEREN